MTAEDGYALPTGCMATMSQLKQFSCELYLSNKVIFFQKITNLVDPLRLAVVCQPCDNKNGSAELCTRKVIFLELINFVGAREDESARSALLMCQMRMMGMSPICLFRWNGRLSLQGWCGYPVPGFRISVYVQILNGWMVRIYSDTIIACQSRYHR